MPDKAEFVRDLTAAAQEMAVGMLHHAGDQQVLADLEPSDPAIHLDASALAQARGSMTAAWQVDWDVASTYAVSRVSDMVRNLADKQPAFVERGVAEAAVKSMDSAVYRVVDLVVTLTFASLLPVFEASVRDYPKQPGDYLDVMSAMRLWSEEVDRTIATLGPIWDKLKAATDAADPYLWGQPGTRPQDMPLFKTHMVADHGTLLHPLELAFAGRQRFTFEDGRLVEGGDEVVKSRFERDRLSGVMRLTDGRFTAIKDGSGEGPFRAMAGAFGVAGLHLLGAMERA